MDLHPLSGNSSFGFLALGSNFVYIPFFFHFFPISLAVLLRCEPGDVPEGVAVVVKHCGDALHPLSGSSSFGCFVPLSRVQILYFPIIFFHFNLTCCSAALRAGRCA
jgi:hypothetical protein